MESIVKFIFIVVFIILNNIRISAYNVQECRVLEYFGKNNLCQTSRPVSEYSQAVTVYLFVQLFSIHTLDEKQQTLVTSAWLEAKWKDDNKTWDKFQFNDVDSLLLPAKEIWMPEMCITNELSGENCLKPDDNDKVYVNFDGDIHFGKSKDIKSQCQMDITNYPFDQQECTIRVGTRYFTDEKVRFKGIYNKISMDNYQENGVWEVLKTSVQEERQNYVRNYTEVHFVITMKRKPLYYVYYVVLPVVLMSMLNIFSFLLPIESGEKISFSVSVFLSLAVFMSFISTNLPEQSNKTFHFGTYVFIELWICATTIILEVIVIRIFHRRYECKVGRPWILLLPKKVKDSASDITNDHDAEKTNGIENQKVGIKEWEFIARRLDICFCVMITLVNILSFVIFLASVLKN